MTPLSALDTGAISTTPQASGRAAKGASRAEIQVAAQKFEAVFASQMLQFMFEGVKTDPEFGGGNAEDMYRSLMVDEYGKQLAKRGGLGIADAVARTMIAAQEGRA